MLTLLLLRHAKAGPAGPEGDFARPLVEKGRADAARLGAHLTSIVLRPRVALVSSATRTRETFEIVSAGSGTPLAARFDDGLFSATALQIRDRLDAIPDTIDVLMVVGHNPGLQDVAIALARDGDGVEIERMRNRFPPCSLVVLSFDTDSWADASRAGGRLDLFLPPDDLFSSH